MRRLKVFATILLSLAILLVCKNISFAADLPDGKAGINHIKASMGADVGKTINIGGADVSNSDGEFCIKNGNSFSWQTRKEYQVMDYIEINDMTATKDGNSIISPYNRLMYYLLAGNVIDIGSDDWGSGSDQNEILWCCFYYWVQSVGNPLGIDPSFGINIENAMEQDYWTKHADDINKLCEIVNSDDSKGGIMDLYLLKPTKEFGWQHILIAVPRSKDSATIDIVKIDADTGESLSGVTFVIKDPGRGYLKKPGPNPETDWGHTDNIDEAYHFTTDGSGHIKIEGSGIYGDVVYEIHEIANSNAGYEANIGQVTKFYLYPNGSAQVTVTNKKEPEEPEVPEPGKGEGIVEISGKVWEDDFGGKGNSSDGIFGAGDLPLDGVIVNWRTADGRLISTTTTSGGTYTMQYISQFGNIIKSVEPFEYNMSVLEMLTNSYIEFEYDGLKYITVAPDSIGELKSRAKEVESTRVTLDSSFGEITKDSVQTAGYPLTYSTGTDGTLEVNAGDWRNFTVKATTKDVATKLLGTIWHDRYDEQGIYGHYELNDKEGAYKYGPGANYTGTRKESGEEYVDWCYPKSSSNIESRILRGQGSDGSYADWEKECGGHTIATLKYKKATTLIVPFTYTNPLTGVQSKGETELKNVDTTNTAYEYHWDKAYYKFEYYSWDIKCTDKKEIWDALYDKDKLGRLLGISIDKSKGEEYISVELTKDMIVNPSDAPYSHSVGGQEKVETYFKIDNMNLGLVRRERPDIALTSDIKQVDVIMKGQQYTYLYNQRGIANLGDDAYFVEFHDETYVRKVNPSDISYINYNQTNDLKIYITYNIIAKNQSATTPMIVGEIANYYDSRCTVMSTDWTTTSKYGNSYSDGSYNAVYSTALAGTIIMPGQKSPIVTLVLKVNDDTVKSLIGADVLVHNISEINTYSTLYGENTRYSDGETAGARGKTNTQYAGIDLDSIPGNSMPGELYEDDTDKAPTFQLGKDEQYKKTSGIVWEDTDNNTSDNERLGNGVKDGNENTVAGVKVKLIKVNDDGSKEDAYLYTISGSTAVRTLAETTTGNGGEYTLEGIVVDNYIIEYTYGNDGMSTTINGNEINARNYKSTIVTTEPIRSAIEGGNLKWHLTQQDNASVAVDYLKEDRSGVYSRDKIDNSSLTYATFNDKFNMTAHSAPFKVQVEYTETQEQQVDASGGSFEHDWTIFDFGIIERPREDIVLDKTISNLKITLANGQVLTEGDPRTETLDYTKAIGVRRNLVDLGSVVKNRDRSTFKNNSDKLLSIEMDSELIQGARIDITYAITVTNNSEIDYNYEDGNSYYYYGNQAGLLLIDPTVQYVVDYVDAELTCTVGDKAKEDSNRISDVNIATYKNGYVWAQVEPQTKEDNSIVQPADILMEKGLISEATNKALKEGNYLVFITDAFDEVHSGESKTVELFASKLLGNQGEDYTYENHAEILKTGGKVARTIDKVDNGTQVTKTYKPGNYVPSLDNRTINTDISLEEVGLHEQDDDRITIRITPPTGSSNNIIMYIIVGMIALVILGGGIYIIKKKVVGR